MAYAHQVFEEVQKNSLLVTMRSEGSAIVFKEFDLVFSVSDRGTNMKVGRVFVTENAVLNLCPLPPVGCNGSIMAVQRKLDRKPKIGFERRQRPGLFQLIQEIDSGMAV